MGSEHVSKTFKSGNTVAVRLPKSLGFTEGEQVRLVEISPGNIRVEALPQGRRKLNVDAFGGKGAGLKPLAPEDRVFEERELDWEGNRLRRDD